MIATLTGIGSTIANSRAAQIALGAGLFVLSFLYWLAQHDRRLLQNEKLRQDRKALQKDQAIRKNSNEAVEAADTVRANTERVSSPELRDEHPGDYHYRD